MNDKEKTELSGNYTRMALPLMTRHGIPTTPRNYTVWYNYVSGINQALTDELDTLIQQDTAFTDETNERLFWEFCADKDEIELKNLRQDLQQMLLAIIEETSSFTGQTEQFGTSISDSVSKLSEDVSVKEIRSVVNEVIEKTRSITLAGQHAKSRIEDTTVELESLQKAFAEAKAETLQDFLTSVPNRKAFNEKLTTQTSQASREKTLCLLMIDIDHFKRFNDQHGHIIGDEVLKFVARQIDNNIRGWDFLARYGGEEFSVLLPDTSLQGAVSVAGNINKYFDTAILKSRKTDKPLGKISVSIGVSQYQEGETIEAFVDRADRALYKSKSTGRNRVTSELDL